MDPTSTAGTATITIRCIRSFEHRNLRNIVMAGVPLNLVTEQLKSQVLSRLQSGPGVLPPFRNYPFDTFKIETQAYGFKTNDPVINREGDDEFILKDGVTLAESGVKNETEISFFMMEDYLKYKKNPVTAW